MPSNFTEHIKLNQWDPSDAVLRKDFNEDNRKLDEAVGEALDEVTALRRVVTNLAYHVGQLSIVDSINRNLSFMPCAMIYNSFFTTEVGTFTGGVKLEDHRLKLSGAGAAGTYEMNYTIPGLTAKRTQLWVHCDGYGTTSFTVNGTPMTQERSFLDQNALTNNYGYCRVYTWTGEINETCNIVLKLDCGSSSSMEVYDYYVAFL